MTENSAFKVDLSNCEREPIHVLGNIQPFGFLLTIGTDWFVTRASINLDQFIGVAPRQAIGTALLELFCEKAVHSIRNRITLLRGPDAVERLFNIALQDGGALFDLALHFSGGEVVIEAEPSSQEEIEASAMVRAMVARLNQSDGMAAYFREGARQVRALTGFDRVMVYRFDDQGSGEVVAESLKPGTDSFLGLHYPASDIPAQARRLYLRNIFRVIADVNAVPVPIVPALDEKGQALDQSLSVLRAVSPIHIEYLKNMGVAASLSISIIVNGKLWGLFACHHYAPRLPSFAYRTAAELFGQMFSLMLESRERHEAMEYETRARALSDRLMATVAQDEKLLENPAWIGDMVFDTIPADGVGVWLDGTVALAGLTPDHQAFAGIVQALNGVTGGDVFATNALQTLLPEAASYADRAAGLIAIPLSRAPGNYVVLFRSEQLRSVRWAGNPEKSVELGPHGDRLTPRKSFELWSELVKGQSLPFTSAERRIAESLRSGMLEVLMRLSDAAEKERVRAHERQDLLIAELNHRVRNILALIRGLISQSRQSRAASVEDFIATLDDRIRAMARAHDQITADRWGPASLRELIETEAGAYLGEKRGRVAVEGPNMLIQPSAFTSLALVVHEMVTNAAKYGALSDNGTVKVQWSVAANGNLILEWSEAGGPMVVAPTRRGFGSTIIEQSVPFDLGGDATIEYRLEGFHARFVIPARHVAGQAPDAGAGESLQPKPAIQAGLLKDKRVLLVEDSMIIALDAEDVLKALGAGSVITATGVDRALRLLEGEHFDLGLLDVNLGTENSVAVADALSARKVPFLFATGYGDGNIFLKDHAGVPVIKKPYGMDEIAKAVRELA